MLRARGADGFAASLSGDVNSTAGLICAGDADAAPRPVLRNSSRTMNKMRRTCVTCAHTHLHAQQHAKTTPHPIAVNKHANAPSSTNARGASARCAYATDHVADGKLDVVRCHELLSDFFDLGNQVVDVLPSASRHHLSQQRDRRASDGKRARQLPVLHQFVAVVDDCRLNSFFSVFV